MKSKKTLRPLEKIDPNDSADYRKKEDLVEATSHLEKRLYDLLYTMFAEGKRSLLIVLQGIDTSGKDGVVRHLFGAANPQGLKVFSFKKPTEQELKHDFLWRCHKEVPEAGFTAIFNRSYYEEVTTTRVHKELLKKQCLPTKFLQDPQFFQKRFAHINDFEQMLSENGTLVMKFFLHISKAEQKRRLEARLLDRTKNWKFSEADLIERKFWNQYQKAFNEMITHTNTSHAPWHVIPADKKWYRNYLINKAIVEELEKLKMRFPKVAPSFRQRTIGT